ncbi:MAG: serine/threonine protein kinase [Akkermansia sp.]|nr:serine/threonine protein kinase [Akkermansia sp.]
MIALPPQTRIGNYKILKAIGQGGFGVTYVAWDCSLERTVVLKECFPAQICSRAEDGSVRPVHAGQEELYRQAMVDMRREACTLAQLNHERVVRVYEVFESHGGLFYVMPWLDGGTLEEVMAEAAEEGRLIEHEKARAWLLDVLDGLSYLHSQKFLHRDLKPANIMFDANGRPVIIDFGAAVFCGADATITQGAFSPQYAAPEQVSGKGELGGQLDLYALAATWYELISGKVPEPAVKRMFTDELVPLGELPGMSDVSKELVESVMKNLALQPSARCASAAEWRAWLLEDKAPASVRKKNLPFGMPRQTSLLLAGCAVFLAGGLGAFLLQDNQVEPMPSAPAEQASVPASGEGGGSGNDDAAKLADFVESFIAEHALESKVAELARLNAEARALNAEYEESVRRFVAEATEACANLNRDERYGYLWGSKRSESEALMSQYIKRFNELALKQSLLYSEITELMNEPEQHVADLSTTDAMMLLQLKRTLCNRYEDKLSLVLDPCNEDAFSQLTRLID